MTFSDPMLLARTLREQPWGEKTARILSAALSAVDPARLIQEKVSRQGNQVHFPGEVVDLDEIGRVFLLGLGKAARSMTFSLADLLPERLHQGYILTKGKPEPLPSKYQQQIEIFGASHPVPGRDGLLATREILSGLSDLKKEDLVLIVLSGGGSALFIQPAQGLTLSQLQKTNQVLLECGADIQEINILRKHLSLVKGGQLAKHLQPARVITLILSDVIGDPLDMIASGPTVPDPTTYQDALAVIEKYRLQNQLPQRILEHLARGQEGQLPETPKPDHPCFKRLHATILGGNRDALLGGINQAKIEGFHASMYPQPLTGEARDVGRNLALTLRKMAQFNQPAPRPACLIAGGETTVTLTSTHKPGIGGRNLELALSALPILDGLENCLLATLATDGEDGVSGAAGAVVSGSSFAFCQQLGMDPAQFLESHDSYSLFRALGDLLQTGPTGTNVNDLCFLFAF